jgi:hypothetical protein
LAKLELPGFLPNLPVRRSPSCSNSCHVVLGAYFFLYVVFFPASWLLWLRAGYQLGLMGPSLYVMVVVLHIACWWSDPGYMDTLSGSSGSIIDRKFCEPCRQERLLSARSKHSWEHGKCVARFDHYCPWVDREVGQRNAGRFAGFLTALLLSLLHYLYHGANVWVQGNLRLGRDPLWVVAFLLTEHALSLIFAGFVGYLVWRTVYNWGRNVCHYEVIKAIREPEPWRATTLIRMLNAAWGERGDQIREEGGQKRGGAYYMATASCRRSDDAV